VSDQTLEAPPIQVPETPPREAWHRRRTSAIGLAKRHPWVLAAIGLLIVSTVIVLWARVRPGYDPYGWLVWGKLTVHWKLDTNGAPSWKPLPFLFTVPYSVVGHYSLWLWMITSVAISLSGVIFAWRIAFRLVGSPPERRYASYAAGLFAGAFVIVMQDPLGYSYTHYLLSAESDTMIVAICLAAVDFHLGGRHRLAFWLWWLGALGRPEVWPFWVLAGLWLWRGAPEYRRWLIASVVLLVVLWFGIPGITSKSFLTAGNIAENSPRAIHGNKVTGTIHRFYQLEPLPVWIAAAVTVALAALRRQRAILLLVAGALLWVVIEIAFALHGFPAVPRYMFEPGAIVAVLGGVFVGQVILEVPPLITAYARRMAPSALPARAAGQLGNWGAVVVLAVLVGAMLPSTRSHYKLERRDLTHERARATEINRLSTVVSRLGATNILACGQPNIPIGYQSAFAWYAGVKVGELYVSKTYLRLHPHPLVNIYPIANGWKAFPSHVDAAHAAACHHMRLVLRS
jgi:hypothetical protein